MSLYSFPEFGEYFYDHCFQLFIRYIICFIRVFFFPWILVLIFCLKHILMSYYFVWLSLFVFITLGIISYLPSLKIHCYVGVVSHSGFQSQPRGLVFLMLDLRTGVPNVVLKQLFFFRKDSQAHDVRSLLPPWCPLLGHLQGIWVPTRLLLFPSYPSQSVFFFFFFLIFFIVQESFCILQVFLRIVLQVLITLVCSWEKVSLEFSYSTILILSSTNLYFNVVHFSISPFYS